MARKMSIGVDGINLLEERVHNKFDMHCPLMSTRGDTQSLNYWSCQCKIRQQDPTLHRTCFPFCRVKESSAKTLHAPDMKEVLRYGKMWYKQHELGSIQTDIAKKYNTSPATVSRYISIYLNSLGEINAMQQTASIHMQNAKTWHRLYIKEDMRIADISEMYKTSKTTIRKYIHAYVAEMESTCKM